MKLRLESNRWIMQQAEPLQEGEVPGVSGEDYDPDYQDPAIREYENFAVEEKDEFYAYVVRCLKCGTRFIAFDPDYETVREYCPGCGERLVNE